MKTLAGRRILITRAQHQASQLAELLAAAGAEVISIPTIEIQGPEDWTPFDAALRRVGSFEWLVLTSANAVDALRRRVDELQMGPVDFSGIQIAVIGPATAKALEPMGLRAVLMPEVAVAEELAAALRTLVSGKNVLLPQAAGARDVLAAELKAAGAVVTCVEAYRNVVPAGAATSLWDAFADDTNAPDAVAFTSSSTAVHFFALLKRSGAELPRATVLASIGPITSATLRGLGFAVTVEAAEHSVVGLVAAMEKYFSRENR